jgi:NADH:ubiquinone oxidoreductase subunit E
VLADPAHEIVVCMGSACFSRGNAATVKTVQEYVKSKGLVEKVEITGTLCQRMCHEGPNIQVDGDCICGIEPATLPAILDKALGL